MMITSCPLDVVCVSTDCCGVVLSEPTLFACAGNHDWYDGLTTFLRLFCEGKRIGGWRTEQTRSYFVVQLPQRWWLVGVDTQLGTYIDDPQIRYFREHLSSVLQPGDGVIVAVPSRADVMLSVQRRSPGITISAGAAASVADVAA